MAGLQFAEVPGYSALILRRTFADLKLPGALLDRSREWLSGTPARWNSQDHRWRFPSGASLQFGYAEHEEDVRRYQSSEFQFIGVDEASQFTERQLLYMFSRLRRRVGIPVPIRYRLGSNPGGPAHEFIKSRYITAGGAAGRVFVPARLDDNPHLDREQYRLALAELDPVTRAQLLNGDWDAFAGGRFRPEWFAARYSWRGDYLIRPGKAPVERKALIVFGTCDSAASVKDDADPTVACVWAITPDNDLVWLDMRRERLEVPDIVPMLRRLHDAWGVAYWAIEGGGTQKGVAQIAARAGLVVKEMLPRGDKLVRATPAIVACEAGRVYLPVAAPWLADALGELVLFTGDEKKDAHDDVVDNLSYAVMRLDRKQDERRAGFAPRMVHQR